MYLHNNKDLFSEVITEVNTKTGIAQSIVEKDYYVSIILKLLCRAYRGIPQKKTQIQYPQTYQR